MEATMDNSEKNSYSLNRTWWDWSFDNQSKVKPQHGILYMWAIEQNNRCGWADEFGFPSEHAMKCTGIRAWKTYSNTLNDLVDWGFIEMRERSKNQHTANIIHLVHNSQEPSKTLDVSRLNEMDIAESALVSNAKATTKASSKQLLKRLPKQVEYIKQVNKETSKKVKEVSMGDNGYPINPNQWVFDAWDKHYLKFTGKRIKTHMLSTTDKDNLKVIMKELNNNKRLLESAMVGLLVQELGELSDFKNLKHLLKDEGVNIQKYIDAQETGNRNLYTPKKKIE